MPPLSTGCLPKLLDFLSRYAIMGTMTRFIGDVHGHWVRYLNAIYGCDDSIQVGDFGVGFPVYGKMDVPPKIDVPPIIEHGNHRFIHGNHDDPYLCKELAGFIPDGTVEGDVMFHGGAYSIDKSTRTPGLDWWPDEEASYADLVRFIGKYEEVKPRMMVSHDCPDVITDELFPFKLPIGSRTRTAFSECFRIHQPEIWVFGHWHESRDKVIDGTRFICLNQLETIDLEEPSN